MEAQAGSLPPPEFQSTDSKECRDPVTTRRCAHGEGTHTCPSQHHPSSPRHRHTHISQSSPPTNRHKAQHSRASGTHSHSLCAPAHRAAASRCRKRLCWFPFAEFFSILLCLPSHFPGRRYSRGENKLPHLLLCTSCTLRWLLNPNHRHHALQTCRHPSCEVSGGCCQQFYKRGASDQDFVKCSKAF